MKVIPGSVSRVEMFSKGSLIFIQQPQTIIYEDEEFVDELLCDRESKCEKTVDLTDIVSASITNEYFKSEVILKNQVVCDDVCELLGGPPTRWELARAWWVANIVAPTRRAIHKIINIQYRGTTRADGYREYSWFISIDLFKKNVFSYYGHAEK